MPFIPHTQSDIDTMLQAIGETCTAALFDEIPDDMRFKGELNLPDSLSEMALMRLMQQRARRDEVALNFVGAGAYEHHIPAAVWDLASRGEFMTAYTPYQAEASQGTLQLIYEFQTMISRLTRMEVANASVYDGASALAEAMLMAVRANKKNKSRLILVAGNLNPRYLKACQAIVKNQGLELRSVPFSSETGCIEWPVSDLEDAAALAIAYPNFFGGLDAVDELTTLAHEQGALVIGVVNPTAMALLKPPGSWGEQGADIVVGDGQPLGIPLSSGGPYLGFMCCKKQIVRQMPGRIIGRTEDSDGTPGFTLTLQAREQHIRRGKATSNICTNQGLLVTAATIYMSLLGSQGLREVAVASHKGLGMLRSELAAIGITPRFNGPCFHEQVFELPVAADAVVNALVRESVVPGLSLAFMGERFAHSLLINVTETKTEEDFANLVALMQSVVKVEAA
ncbi:MAG: aminomethyl-transferring glycine dehydrogenase subunit GcvPA [Pseudomonadota bacterium]|nr:aminomethyl-transferring glycine dehydrogenase [Gammaproteobacteria bacterium]MEC8601210.1 aminomethyl-transferring glycine dehydrogenase subunit GcvPA [Pseudomonadota bacterium]